MIRAIAAIGFPFGKALVCTVLMCALAFLGLALLLGVFEAQEKKKNNVPFRGGLDYSD